MALPPAAMNLGGALLLTAGKGTLADGTGGRSEAGAARGAVAVCVTAAPDSTVPPVARPDRGAPVRPAVRGAGAGTLHPHGHDIEAKGRADQPPGLVFDAVRAGRFPIVVHIDDPILGARETANSDIEVRDP